jgi:hypothetical protein
METVLIIRVKLVIQNVVLVLDQQQLNVLLVLKEISMMEALLVPHVILSVVFVLEQLLLHVLHVPWEIS